MIVVLPNILSPQLLAKLQSAFTDGAFVDGKQTAGAVNEGRKRNEEIDGSSALRRTLAEDVRAALLANNDFRLITQPRRIGDAILSRYADGMFYGDHSDNTVMGLGKADPWRADISFTLFLSEPASYDGGELVLNTDMMPQSFKLPVGHMVVYSTTVLHRVNPVTRGERRAMVGWVQSMVRDPNQRQTLLDIAQVLNFMQKNAQGGINHPEAVRLEKAYSNLMRMWADL